MWGGKAHETIHQEQLHLDVANDPAWVGLLKILELRQRCMLLLGATGAGLSGLFESPPASRKL